MSVETWRYSLPNQKGEGWAIIFMDSIGCFTALSDWGNVAYRWPDHGWGEGDFRKFLLRCDDSYLTGKFGQGRREYDPEGTVKNIERYLEEQMNEGRMDIGQVEEERQRVRDHSDLHTQHDLFQWVQDSELDVRYEVSCERYERDVTSFVKHVMPRLRELLKQDLKL